MTRSLRLPGTHERPSAPHSSSTCQAPLTFIAFLTDPELIPEDDFNRSWDAYPPRPAGPAEGAPEIPASPTSAPKIHHRLLFLTPSLRLSHVLPGIPGRPGAVGVERLRASIAPSLLFGQDAQLAFFQGNPLRNMAGAVHNLEDFVFREHT